MMSEKQFKVDYREAYWKMDKYMYELDEEGYDEFYKINDLTQMTEYLTENIQDEDKFYSYIHEEDRDCASIRGLAKYILESRDEEQ